MMGQFKAGKGHEAAIAALLVCLTTVPVWAENVPLPKPRPRAVITGSIVQYPANRGISPQALAANAQSPPAPTPRAQAPNPITNPFAALLGKGSSAGALNPEQRAIIGRVNTYLSNTQVLSGKFVQVGPDGGRTQGDFNISKPGKLRFEYDDPSPIELIADGQSVVVRDRRLATQDIYPLSQTPLRFLLSDKVDLMRDTTLTAVYADDVFITVVVEEKNGIVGTSRLMMMFAAKDMQLKQWTVTDPQGYDTTVAVYNLDSTRRPDPNLFKIDFTSYRN
jgi:outer membrane lipoprotein-sorting protein